MFLHAFLCIYICSYIYICKYFYTHFYIFVAFRYFFFLWFIGIIVNVSIGCYFMGFLYIYLLSLHTLLHFSHLYFSTYIFVYFHIYIFLHFHIIIIAYFYIFIHFCFFYIFHIFYFNFSIICVSDYVLVYM